MEVRPTMTHKLTSITKNNKNSSLIYLFKLFKKINAFETQISYCVRVDEKKYFADNLIGAEKLIKYLKEGVLK